MTTNLFPHSVAYCQLESFVLQYSLLPQSFTISFVIVSIISILTPFCLQVCLELLIAVALRNRDRIVLIWPLVHEYLSAIMTPNGAKAANPLVARVCLFPLPLRPCKLYFCTESAHQPCTTVRAENHHQHQTGSIYGFALYGVTTTNYSLQPQTLIWQLV